MLLVSVNLHQNPLLDVLVFGMRWVNTQRIQIKAQQKKANKFHRICGTIKNNTYRKIKEAKLIFFNILAAFPPKIWI